MTTASEHLVALLAPALADYCERNSVDVARWRGRPLGDLEAVGFLRALDSGIAAVNLDTAECAIIGLGGGAKRYQLYMAYDGGAGNPGRVVSWSWQEMFDQIAFAAELTLDHGWPRTSVHLEVDRLDVVAGPAETSRTNPLLGAEMKVTDTGGRGLAAMMAVFAELNGSGPPATVAREVRTNAESKYHCLRRLRPAVFVEVAPGVRRAHDLTYTTDEVVHFIPRGRSRHR